MHRTDPQEGTRVIQRHIGRVSIELAPTMTGVSVTHWSPLATTASAPRSLPVLRAAACIAIWPGTVRAV